MRASFTKAFQDTRHIVMSVLFPLLPSAPCDVTAVSQLHSKWGSNQLDLISTSHDLTQICTKPYILSFNR